MLGRYATWQPEVNTLASCTWYEAEDLGTELAKILLKGFASKEERQAMLDTLDRIKGPAPFSRTLRFLSNETFVCEQVGDWPTRFAHLRQPPIPATTSNTQATQTGVVEPGASGMGYSGEGLRLMRDATAGGENEDEEREAQNASDTMQNTPWMTQDERRQEEVDPYARGSSGPSQHQPNSDDSDDEMNEEERQQRILKRLVKRRSLPPVEDESEEAQQEKLEEEAFFAAARRMYRDLVHERSTFTRERFEQEYQLTWVQTHWRGKNNIVNRLT